MVNKSTREMFEDIEGIAARAQPKLKRGYSTQDIKEAAAAVAQITRKEYKSVFDAIDSDGSGTVNFNELRSAFSDSGIEVNETELKRMVTEFDADKSGGIDFDEFVVCLERLQTGVEVSNYLNIENLERELEKIDQVLAIELKQRKNKQLLWLSNTMNDPQYSPTAKVVSGVVMTLVAVSCVAFCVETLPDQHRKNEEFWFVVEVVCISAFSIELLLRLVSCDSVSEFFSDVLNLVDCAAILPFYLEQLFDDGSDVGASSAVLRVIRLVRVFRLFKLSRYLTWVNIFTTTLRRSLPPLGVLLFLAIVATICFSAALYFLERGTWDEDLDRFIREDGTPSPFNSIPAAMWFTFVSMTTVGYGDFYPITAYGKLVTAVTAITGILIFAAPISVISANFQREYKRLMKISALKMEHNRLTENGLYVTENVYLESLKSMGSSSMKRLLGDIRSTEQDNRRELLADIFASITFKPKTTKQLEEERFGATS